ncbi:whirlin-like isoform X2 [Rhopilema esculentum]|uniref:whirlin-like isoform X2 n=1 Tax=Rhopilema esculentum TaxID=499914 RepID=UPI0031D1C682
MSDEEVEPLDVDGKDIELFLNGHQICVELSKGADGFGLTLEGGADRPLYSKDDGIFITSIRKGSNADKLDCLEVGDKVLEVNSTNLEKMKHADAVELFRSSKKVRLVIHKHIGCILQATELSSSRESMDSPSEDPRDLKDFSPVGFVIGIAVGCFVVFAVRRYLLKR